MKTMTRGTLTALAVTTLLFGSAGLTTATAAPQAQAQAGPTASDTLARRSAEATTPAEHASVARDYRLRAEAFEEQAQEHEADAVRLAERRRFPVELKMPAVLRRDGERERRLAMQARRAAREAYERADHHIRLAVEEQLAQ
ncbi:MAG: hypothetical protein AB7G23_18930 [Vicinamibacterales bacterium]